jgi:hypothetical protein
MLFSGLDYFPALKMAAMCSCKRLEAFTRHRNACPEHFSLQSAWDEYCSQLYVRYPLFPSDLKQRYNVQTYFSKTLQYWTSLKFVQWFSSTGAVIFIRRFPELRKRLKCVIGYDLSTGRLLYCTSGFWCMRDRVQLASGFRLVWWDPFQI